MQIQERTFYKVLEEESPLKFRQPSDLRENLKKKIHLELLFF